MYFKYPLEINNGDIMLHSSEDVAIQDAIRHCLLTVQEERIMQPEYGMPDIIFSGATLQDLNTLVVDVLTTGLEGYDVLFSTVCTFTEDGLLSVDVFYQENKVNVTLAI